MKKLLLFVTAWSLFMLSACVMVPAHHGEGVVIAPALPAVVELTDPYYFYGDFHYYYHSDRWSYSKSKNGPVERSAEGPLSQRNPLQGRGWPRRQG